jgi:hypothetical protein
VDDASPLNASRNVADLSSQMRRRFDPLFFLQEIDIIADDLAKLPPSIDRTALELRLAQMRQAVEFCSQNAGFCCLAEQWT